MVSTVAKGPKIEDRANASLRAQSGLVHGGSGVGGLRGSPSVGDSAAIKPSHLVSSPASQLTNHKLFLRLSLHSHIRFCIHLLVQSLLRTSEYFIHSFTPEAYLLDLFPLSPAW